MTVRDLDRSGVSLPLQVACGSFYVTSISEAALLHRL